MALEGKSWWLAVAQGRLHSIIKRRRLLREYCGRTEHIDAAQETAGANSAAAVPGAKAYPASSLVRPPQEGKGFPPFSPGAPAPGSQ
eukprot:scaffold108425_cov15-Tisochrysis_lutea.AAC.3